MGKSLGYVFNVRRGTATGKSVNIGDYKTLPEAEAIMRKIAHQRGKEKHMIRPEIAARIRETCDIGLADWYKRNMQEVDTHYNFYADHPRLKALVLAEAQYILEVLSNRQECPHHHIKHHIVSINKMVNEA